MTLPEIRLREMLGREGGGGEVRGGMRSKTQVVSSGLALLC
jgi:hypothetical protein